MLNKRGKLVLKAGGRVKKLFGIFASPVQPELKDYYEPWTYDYKTLVDAPLGDDFPVARPKSLITGKDTKITWSANWDDDLGGSAENGHLDPIVEKVRRESEDKIKFAYEQTFMFYLPRICEHCLNPSCMASCPSGAIYKRVEDGIVLVDQDKCRGWRQCVTGCPYKKIYFNHKTGKAEKCTFCYPRVEVGLPTVCSETCVGRLRYLGLFLYDADAVTAAASVTDPQELYDAQMDVLLDPNDPAVQAEARAQGIPEDWIDAARRSPVYALAKVYKVALPLHPEYRTMPMVWYVPPLSPVVDLLRDQGHDGEDAGNLFGAIDALRIPVEYLAELFTAGDAGPGHRGAEETRGHALLHARDQPRQRPRRLHPRSRGHGQPDHVRDVPADGDREVRGALRHPQGPRGTGPRPGGDGLLAGFRGRTGHAGFLPVRRSQRPARPGGRGNLQRPARPADLRRGARRHHPARPGEPAELGRDRGSLRALPGKGAAPGGTRPGPGTPAEGERP